MNRIYKTLWNEQTGTYVAVPENSKARGKRSGSSVSTGSRSTAPVGAWTLTLCALALLGAGLLGDRQVVFAQALTGDSLTVTGDADVGGALNVDGKSTFEDDLDVKKNLKVDGTTSLQGVTAQTLSVAGQSTLGALTAGTTTLSGLTVTGGTTHLAGLSVTGTTTLAGLTVSGSSALGAVTANTVTSMGATTVGGPLSVAGQTTLNGGLDAAGNQITNVGNGTVATGSTDAINAGQVYALLNEEGDGIKYFRANSTKPDAQATGVDSIAIGPDSVSGGVSSFAAGHNARTGANNAVAVGANSNASATGALAAGTGTKASGVNAAAIGTGAIAEGAGSVAVGDGAKTLTPSDGSDPIAAIAIGKDSVSSGVGSTAIGHEASASGGNTLAFGTSATASGANGIAMGKGAVAAAQNNISIGNEAGLSTTPSLPNDNSHNIAMGAQSGQNVIGQFNLAIGDQAGNRVDGNENIAFGRQAGVGVKGDANVSIGSNANTGRTANRAVSIGEDSSSETEGVAIGYLASAGNTGVALGRQTSATGTGTAVGPNSHADSGYVALGLNSRASQADVSGSSAFTNRSFSGSAVSVGSSAAGGEFTRRIVNVEDGAQETDAVNVRQLQQAVSGIDLSDIDFAGGVINNLQTQIDQNMQQYVSINDGGTDKGNKNNNGAVATDSIAIGPDATTKNRDAIAIGHMAGAEGDSAVVLGHNIKGLGKNSTTVGNSQSEARHESGVAIGTHVISRDENSIVIGRDSYTDRQDNGPSVKNSIVIGTQSSSTAVEGIVIGKDSVVNADRGIAQGSAAHATAANAMAFGTGARGAGVDSQASGTGAGSYAERGIALGAKARSGQENPNADDLGSNRDSIAIGSDSVAEMNSSIAAGRDARATANFAQALGYKAQASGVESIAQGSNALALGQQAIAMGAGAQSTAASALAMGTGAHSTAGNAIAMGAEAQSTAAGAVAIGRGATAENGRSVALGDGAATDGPVGTANATLNNLTYGAFAGTAPIATVSVGTAGEKRTITNVAAGRISDTSTDAINGSQLYATNAVLGNFANTTKGILGGNATLDPHGSLSMTDIGNTGEDNVHDAIKYAAQGWNLSTNSGVASNVAPGGEVDLANTDGNIKIAQAGGNVQFNLADDLEIGNSITLGDTLINSDSLTVNNLTVSGNTKLGDSFVVNGGGVYYEGPIVDGNHITNKTYVDGAIGSVAQTPLTFAGDAGTSVDRLLGETVNMTGGAANTASLTEGNIGVVADGTDTLAIKLNKDLSLGNTGSIRTGNSLIDNSGLAVAEAGRLTQVGAGNIKVGDGTSIIDINGSSGDITGLANRTLDGADFASQGRAATEEQLQLVHGETQDLADRAVKYDLNPDNTVNYDVVTMQGTTGVGTKNPVNGRITTTGGTQITNVASAGNYTDVNNALNAVNAGDLNNAVQDVTGLGLNFSANDGGDVHRNLGQTLAIRGGIADPATATSGENVITRSTADGISIELAKDVAFDSVTSGDTVMDTNGVRAGTITMSSVSGDIIGLSNLTLDGADFASQGRAATEEQLQLVHGETQDLADRAVKYDLNPDNTVNYDVVTMQGTTGVGTKNPVNGRITTTGGTQITNVASAGNYTDVNNALNAVNAGDLNNAVQDVTGLGLNFSANDGGDVHRNLGQTLAIRGGIADPATATSGENVITRSTADGISIELAKDVAFDSVTSGDTVMDTNGVRVGTDVALTNTGVRAGNIIMSSASGDIIGLSNLTLTGPGFGTSGRAATEEQLQLVHGETQDLADRAVKYDGNVGDPKNKITLEGDASTDGGRTGGTQITNVARGEISADSTDAVNGSQIHEMGESIADGMGGNSKFIDGKLVTELNVGGNAYNNVNDALNGVQTDVDNIGEVANMGWNVQTNGDTASKVGPGGTVQFVDGDNVQITRDGSNITVGMAKDIKVDSVTATTVNANEVVIQDGPTLNKDGIDMNDKQIKNLAEGQEAGDAVNLGQLNRVTGNVANHINRLDNRIDHVDNRASAGVAAALATAGLPQAYLPGKSMFSMGGGTWRGETGYAMGLSSISDNGKWLIKGTASGSSRGDYGGSVGVGYQW